MHFLAQLAALAATAATVVSANTMTFVNQDDTPRRIIFTPSEGHEAVNSVDVSATTK